MESPPAAPDPFPVGTLVRHDQHGLGRVVARDRDLVTVQFGPDIRKISVNFPGMRVEPGADPEMARLKQALREVLHDFGWLDGEAELGRRWQGGTLVMKPGKDGAVKEVPIDVFFRKLIGVRDKLRVLEQKLNAHPVLSGEDKLELQGYVTRCYGSLTTFNVLFADKPSWFVGQSGE
ncbi:hypothetical protein LBMAG53_36460 [Planctomycetota bacterium]|nr:hypothetical protein LBMAG53_36460 [Planctomycetota bacterium]